MSTTPRKTRTPRAPQLTETMINAYLGRTHKHIAEVQRMARLMATTLRDGYDYGETAALLSDNVLKHDQSKFSADEFIPYVWLTAAYASGDRHTFNYPHGMEKRIDAAIKHHYEHNKHHPEFWGDHLAGMNMASMAEMVCDWAAMSTERNGGQYASPLPFYHKAVSNGKTSRGWRFTLKQRERIEWLIVILDAAHN